MALDAVSSRALDFFVPKPVRDSRRACAGRPPWLPAPRHEVRIVRGRLDGSASFVTQLVTRARPVVRRRLPALWSASAWASVLDRVYRRPKASREGRGWNRKSIVGFPTRSRPGSSRHSVRGHSWPMCLGPEATLACGRCDWERPTPS